MTIRGYRSKAGPPPAGEQLGLPQGCRPGGQGARAAASWGTELRHPVPSPHPDHTASGSSFWKEEVPRMWAEKVLWQHFQVTSIFFLSVYFFGLEYQCTEKREEEMTKQGYETVVCFKCLLWINVHLQKTQGPGFISMCTKKDSAGNTRADAKLWSLFVWLLFSTGISFWHSR